MKAKTPFFARFIVQSSNSLPVRSGLQAGRTTKYPSDGDEFQTMKYPSDGDEGGVDI